ncbi:MAG: dihydrofolate reductase, partial [Flavobacteriales bacterium CG11_big_fil_rev_8_21_14_0_20_35_7]
MKLKLSLLFLMTVLLFSACKKDAVKSEKEFAYFSEQFADIKILRYKVPGFENLSLKQKELVYYLTQAGLAGRDIMYDQNYRFNLTIRRALEYIYQNYEGDKTTEDWKNLEIYLKRIWFSNGIHHHYSNDKFKPGFSADYLTKLLKETNTKLEREAFEVIFNDKDAKKVNLDASKDLVLGSAINFYGPNVTEADVDKYYKTLKSPNPLQPLSFGLNSQLLIEDGKVVEKVWKSGGLYGQS